MYTCSELNVTLKYGVTLLTTKVSNDAFKVEVTEVKR